MRKLKVERTEGTYTICVDKDQKFYAIETSDFPKPLTPGTEFTITDEGEIVISE